VSPAAGAWCLHAADHAFSALWPYLQWISRLEAGHWGNQMPAAWTLIAAAAGLLMLLAPRGVPGRYLGAALLAPLFLVAPPAPRHGEVWFTLLDVGQGLAAVVSTQSHVLVYDTGPRFSESFDTGDAVVVPYLRHLGRHSVDTLIVSHGDNDHVGGAASLIDQVPVKRILTSAPDELPGRDTTVCNDTQTWRWDGVRFDMLFPPPGKVGTGNDTSCVLRIADARGHTILLTGDIERATEFELLHNQDGMVAADIVSVPHHGSMTSSTEPFVTAVNPEYALFATGYRNRYGFPKRDVVARYAASGARLYDTAEHGAITFRLDHSPAIRAPQTHRQHGRRYWHSR
jgi:competence protein ComEC